MSNQGWARHAGWIALCGLLACGPAQALDIGIRAEGSFMHDIGIRAEASLMHDDNVSRSIESQRTGDEIFNFSLVASGNRNLTEHARLVWNATLGGEKFSRYDGLSRLSGGLGAELQYRPAATFAAPTFALFGNSFIDRYQSDLRDGYRHAMGVSVSMPVTDRIDFSAAITRNIREGKSIVFDGRDYSARANVDYMLTPEATLYFGFEYRRGDTVASGLAQLAFVNIAEAIVRDDVFVSPQRFAYRVGARTVLTTVGANYAIAEGHSLDLSWRWIQATPTDNPGFVPLERIRYRVNQYSLAYLVRF